MLEEIFHVALMLMFLPLPVPTLSPSCQLQLYSLCPPLNPISVAVMQQKSTFRAHGSGLPWHSVPRLQMVLTWQEMPLTARWQPPVQMYLPPQLY